MRLIGQFDRLDELLSSFTDGRDICTPTLETPRGRVDRRRLLVGSTTRCHGLDLLSETYKPRRKIGLTA